MHYYLYRMLFHNSLYSPYIGATNYELCIMNYELIRLELLSEDKVEVTSANL